MALLVLASCTTSPNKPKLSSDTHEVKALEVINTDQYSYVKVEEAGEQHWIAIPLSEVKIGEVYYYDGGLEMKDFESKSLKRTFPSIFFVDALRTQAIVVKDMSAEPIANKNSGIEQKKTKIDVVDGGVTIATLYENKNELANSNQVVRGEVIKVNNGIMGRNWVHLQDGSVYDGDYDLTLTTMDEVKVGQIVTFSGLVHLNVDFGAGYSYALIMEKATLVK